MSKAFATPWHVTVYFSSFCVKDAHGNPVAYVYFEDDEGKRAALTYRPLYRWEAQRLAEAIANLPKR